jgi:hypothetical protein
MAVGRIAVGKKVSNPSGSMHRQSPVPQPHRQGGLWNFLTWSFFLSQLVAAESFFGSRAHAEGDADSSSLQSPGTPGQPLLAAHVNRLDDGAGTPSATSAQPQGEHSHAHDGSSAHDGVAGAVSVGGHGTAGAVPAVIQGQSVEAQTASPHPSSDADGSPAAILNLETLPAIGAVGNTLDHVVSPVLATLDNTVGSLDALLDHALEVGPTLAVPIVNVADTILQPVSATVDQVAAPLDALLGHALASGVTSLAAPVANTADAILQPAASIVDHAVAPISDVLSIQGDLGSSGTIVLAEVPLAGALPLDDLFSRGTYTAYNLNLTSEPVAASVSLQTGGAAVSIADNVVGDPHGGDGHDHTMTPHSLPTSALDELHLRGLGEGVGLI